MFISIQSIHKLYNRFKELKKELQEWVKKLYQQIL
jgi:hypothetical protein